ncbi:DUF1839 family protein, partial [Clostridioides difficile]|nr:DUF1839 family protein [Clostridioides difficile]
YSFNSVRQLCANFELFGHYARWLQASGSVGPFAEIRAACDRIASEAMVLEFRLARAQATTSAYAASMASSVESPR